MVITGGDAVALVEARGLSVDVPGRRLLEDVGVTVEAGERIAVVGPSGVGKTSLLNCIAGISSPSSGSVTIGDVELSALRPARRAEFRLRHIGMVFQYGELVAELSVLENIALPSRLMGIPRRDAEKRAAEWLERFDLTDRANSLPESLSGGEVQRVGMARALAHEPSLVLADEPTGMLDEENTQRVIGLLAKSARELRAAVVVVTHDPLVAAAADRTLTIQSGRVVSASQAVVPPVVRP